MPFSLISREDAAEQKLIHFFTGRPCKYGHVAPRFVSTGGCIKCNLARSARFRKNAPALFTYALHPEDMAAALAYCQALDIQRGRIPAGKNQLMIGRTPMQEATREEIETARIHAFGPAGALPKKALDSHN